MAKDRMPTLKELHTNTNEAVSEPKYKRGDEVYSYANKDYKGEIAAIRPSTEEGYNHAYQITLKDGQRSKWIDEPSISDEPINEANNDAEIVEYFKSIKHEGEEIEDAITKTANNFKVDPEHVRTICKDVLNEAKFNLHYGSGSVGAPKLDNSNIRSAMYYFEGQNFDETEDDYDEKVDNAVKKLMNGDMFKYISDRFDIYKSGSNYHIIDKNDTPYDFQVRNETKVDDSEKDDIIKQAFESKTMNENSIDELQSYLDDNGIYGYTEDIHAIASGDTVPDNALDDIKEYLEGNEIEPHINLDAIVPKYNVAQLLDAYLGWNGVYGYTEDILEIYGVDFDAVDLFESKMEGNIPLLED